MIRYSLRLQAEKEFVELTKSRRDVQTDLLDIQESLKQIRQKIGMLYPSVSAFECLFI